MMEFEVSIIVPVYNEAEAIKEVLSDIVDVMKNAELSYEIIVVDDGSKDNTAEIVENLEGIKLFRHNKNRGVGRARKTGIKNATAKVIVMIDGDGSYPAKAIPELVKNMADYDMVVGARKRESGSFRLLRTSVKFIIKQLASFVSGEKIPDLNSGLRVFKKETAVKFFSLLPDTHSFVSTITLCYLCNGYEVKYIPVNYYKRKGKSSFHPIKDTFTYFSLVLNTVMHFRPLRFFLPLSFVLFLWSFIRIIIHSQTIGHLRVTEGSIMLFLTGLIIAVLGLIADMIAKKPFYP